MSNHHVIVADTADEARLSIVHWLESYARETMAGALVMNSPQRTIALARSEQLHEAARMVRAMPVQSVLATLYPQEQRA